MHCATVELHSPHAKFGQEGPQWNDGNNADTTSSEPYFRAYLYGSWDDWKEGICLTTSYNLRGQYLMVDYVPAVMTLSPGHYQYKFKFVWRDGTEVWRVDPDETQVKDEAGNTNNLLEVPAN